MRFLVDAQLPPALVRLLAREGHGAIHVGSIGMQAASDPLIWDHALANGYVILTKDEDFAHRRALASAGPGVVWVRLPNTRRAAILAWFEAVLPQIVAALERGETLIEIS